MKTKEQIIQKAKNGLKSYYRFKEVDFYELDNMIYLNCKDNVGESVVDVYQELELRRKEQYEE